ncbi:glutathione S-transferase family protein [Prosthecomicrobium sp. N25]|uniref:glutathione S-transferase family protein n=1 Tax=Prosthecomicrobium sp. N25 TaxID=3129254 RepID=UPI003077A093
MKPVVLYDLCTADDRRLSPYCRRIRLALAHKGLPVETVPTPFTAIPRIAGGGQKTVPVIDDGGRLVRDSWAIAEYLEEAYPDRPSLFGGPAGQSAARFVEAWANALLPQISPIVLTDIHALLAPEDQAYFRASREARFGRSLEAVCADREARIPAFREALLPLRLMLRSQPFIGGAGPTYADYAVCGTLHWPLTVSSLELLAPDDPVRIWYAACEEACGLGAGR